MKKWIWVTRGFLKNNDINAFLNRLKETKIFGVILDSNVDDLNSIIPRLKDLNIEVHLWYITMLNTSEEISTEWYAVNKNHRSSKEFPPYVGYYKWLCPTKVEVKQFLKKEFERLASIEGIDGLHLDYIRYSDVILPPGCQPLYDLVQKEELPEYDFCYCKDCQREMVQNYQINILNDLSFDEKKLWNKYRYDKITEIVKIARKVTDINGIKLSAAVFPTPEIAKKLVRQSWTDWEIDMVFPMMYHNFYYKDVDWILNESLINRVKTPEEVDIYPGLYFPKLDDTDLEQILDFFSKSKLPGISCFDASSIDDNHWMILSKF